MKALFGIYDELLITGRDLSLGVIKGRDISLFVFSVSHVHMRMSDMISYRSACGISRWDSQHCPL